MLFVHASSAALVPMLFLTQYRKDFHFIWALSRFYVQVPSPFSFLMSRSMTLVLREHLCCSESVLTNHTR